MKKILFFTALIMSFTINGLSATENPVTTQLETSDGKTDEPTVTTGLETADKNLKKQQNLSREKLAKKIQNGKLNKKQRLNILEKIKKSKPEKVKTNPYGSAFR